MLRMVSWMFVIMLVIPVSLRAQGRDLERYHFELTMGAWFVGVTGHAGSGAASADFDSDLRMGDKEPRFFGKLAVKFSRRNRLFVEGFRFQRTTRFIPARRFEIAGRGLPSGRSVDARAEADYLLAGYQYDVVSRRRGHVGFLVGAGRVQGEAEAALTDPAHFFEQRSAFTGGSAPIGVFGAEGRGYATNWLSVAGEVKGLRLGSRGHFLSSSAHVGIGIGCCVIVQAGYSVLDIRARTGGSEDEIRPRLSGPSFSIVLLDRRR